MPPSPQEIKVRLDSAVDEEGNVLNMAVVLEVVSILEKIPISKEALETTRIGRVINLMRKKTTNEDLAKRAKKLVKKWQKLVSNHFKNLKATDSPQSAGEAGRLTPTINGIIRSSGADGTSEAQPKTALDVQKKSSLKRKRTENSPRTLPYENHSSESKCVTFTQDSTGSLDSQPRNGANYGQTSDDGSSLSDGANKGLVGSNLIKDSISNISVENVENSSETQTIKTESRLKSPLDDKSPLSVDVHIIRPTRDLPRAEPTPERKATDPLPNDFRVIEPEDFTVTRQELPEDFLDPSAEADGVSGCYESGKFHLWTEVITKNEGQLTILPYVNLE